MFISKIKVTMLLTSMMHNTYRNIEIKKTTQEMVKEGWKEKLILLKCIRNSNKVKTRFLSWTVKLIQSLDLGFKRGEPNYNGIWSLFRWKSWRLRYMKESCQGLSPCESNIFFSFFLFVEKYQFHSIDLNEYIRNIWMIFSSSNKVHCLP